MIFLTIVGTVFLLTKNENFRAKLVDIYIWFINFFFFFLKNALLSIQSKEKWKSTGKIYIIGGKFKVIFLSTSILLTSVEYW